MENDYIIVIYNSLNYHFVYFCRLFSDTFNININHDESAFRFIFSSLFLNHLDDISGKLFRL